MLQTRKGIFRSATNAAIFVRTLFACDDALSGCGFSHKRTPSCDDPSLSNIEGRFEPGFPIWTSVSRIICFSRPRQQRICHQGAQTRSAVVRPAGFRRLTNPACCCAIIFSDTAPTILPQPQNLQPQSTMLAARDQQRRDSSEHLAKQPPVQMSLEGRAAGGCRCLRHKGSATRPMPAENRLAKAQSRFIVASQQSKPHNQQRQQVHDGFVCPLFSAVSSQRTLLAD